MEPGKNNINNQKEISIKLFESIFKIAFDCSREIDAIVEMAVNEACQDLPQEEAFIKGNMKKALKEQCETMYITDLSEKLSELFY